MAKTVQLTLEDSEVCFLEELDTLCRYRDDDILKAMKGNYGNEFIIRLLRRLLEAKTIVDEEMTDGDRE